MKIKLVVGVIFLLAAVPCLARDTYVHGYERRDGTYVQGYHRTSEDHSVNNNYGTKGNTNPYTGNDGSVRRRQNDNYGEYNQGNGQGRNQNFGNEEE